MMSILKRMVVGTPIEAPLRKLHRQIRGAPIDNQAHEWELRDVRDTAYVRLLLRYTMRKDSNCIDIGAHGGVFLRQFLEFAPHGRHYAFEPISNLATALEIEFPSVEVHRCALSDRTGVAEFQFVPELPAWSGLKQQPYPGNVNPQTINVPVRRLDDVVPSEIPVAFVKIDVEGAELEVLKGATGLLKRWHPVVYFECGKIHHANYGTSPHDVFDLFESCGMGVHLLDQTLLSRDEFAAVYERSHASGYDRSAWGNYIAMVRTD